MNPDEKQAFLFMEKAYWISDSRTLQGLLKSRYQDAFGRDT